METKTIFSLKFSSEACNQAIRGGKKTSVAIQPKIGMPCATV